MMLASLDDQSALSESNELCSYIISEVFNYAAEDRKRSFEQLLKMSEPVKVRSVKKMAEKIAKRMKKERSESDPSNNSKQRDAEILFGKSQGEDQAYNPMEIENEQAAAIGRSRRNNSTIGLNKRQSDRLKRREAKQLFKEQKMNSEKPKSKYNPWTEDEHKLFVEGVRKHGKDWQEIALHVGTRRKEQI